MAVNEAEAGKAIVDVLSIATVIGTIAQILPAIAAIFTIIWTLIRIFETKTIQQLFKKRRS